MSETNDENMALSDVLGEDQEDLAILSAITKMDLPEKVAKKKKEDEVKKPVISNKETEEYLVIYDSLLTKRYYEESFHIGRRISGVWKSRTTGQSNTIYKLVDAAGFNSGMAVNNYLNLLNMTYSLSAFNGEDLSKKSSVEKLKFLESQPEAVIVALSRNLVEFDAKIARAVEVGQENF